MGLPDYGFMVTPRMSNILPPTQVWAADTGCYQGAEEFQLTMWSREE